MMISGATTATPLAKRLMLMSLRIIELLRSNQGRSSQKTVHGYVDTLIRHGVGDIVGTHDEQVIIDRLLMHEQEVLEELANAE